jgi:hypothetical protein
MNTFVDDGDDTTTIRDLVAGNHPELVAGNVMVGVNLSQRRATVFQLLIDTVIGN